MKIKAALNAYAKGITLAVKPHTFLGWLRHPFLTASNTLNLSKWIAGQDKKNILNDFYSSKRDYSKRFQLYEYVCNNYGLKNEPFDYLEFGVCGAFSFKWWVEHCSDPGTHFYGFDTFEGLPESWGGFAKGDMHAEVPDLHDSRVRFLKGLFQDTLPGFLSEGHVQKNTRKVIHLDADLFSSTLFTLSSLAPYLKKDDILFFDEFNVPNHEFFAFDMFCKSYYVKTRLIGAVNNYYQVAMILE